MSEIPLNCRHRSPRAHAANDPNKLSCACNMFLNVDNLHFMYLQLSTGNGRVPLTPESGVQAVGPRKRFPAYKRLGLASASSAPSHRESRSPAATQLALGTRKDTCATTDLSTPRDLVCGACAKTRRT